MTAEHESIPYLSADEMHVLRFAVRRQLTRWANKRNPNAHQQAQRATLQQVLRILEDNAFAGGCDLHVPVRSHKEAAEMPDGWRKIERGLFESDDGQWRIANPWKLSTELRHRWLVAQRRSSGSGWCMHDGDHATLREARTYVESLVDSTSTA